MEALARAVVKRLLHEPTARVRELDAEHRHARLALLRELFGLEEDAASEAGRGRRGPPAARVTTLRLGTRGSALALAQARVGRARCSTATVELVTITTAGDVDRARGDKSRWVGALEAALLAGEIDLAVHSAKDVPAELAPGPRSWPRRAARSRSTCVVGDLREGARVGTSALRRRAQLLAARPDLEVVEMRGNVDTRLAKREAGEVDALVLAAAGLERLGRAVEARLRSDGVFVPAAGQGVIAVQARDGDRRCRSRRPRVDPCRAGRRALRRARAGGVLPHADRRALAGRAHARVRRDAGRLGVDRRRGRFRGGAARQRLRAAGAVEILRAVSA